MYLCRNASERYQQNSVFSNRIQNWQFQFILCPSTRNIKNTLLNHERKLKKYIFNLIDIVMGSRIELAQVKVDLLIVQTNVYCKKLFFLGGYCSFPSKRVFIFDKSHLFTPFFRFLRALLDYFLEQKHVQF